MAEPPAPEDDSLFILDVKDHSRDKLHFLFRYIDAFTTAMAKKRWSGLHYIDLFAGPGVLRVKPSNELIWGSPLIAAQAEPRFGQIHVCEQDEKSFEALHARFKRIEQPTQPQVLHGNANELVEQIVRAIPRKALSLAFLDPYGLHLDFATLRVLAELRADLVIFFPDHLDALRNWEEVYKDQADSNLDRVLGTTEWRSALENEPAEKRPQILQDIYVSQIRNLGYEHFDYERILSHGHPLYKLIFCSEDKAGGKIWQGISRRERDGQRRFSF